MSVEGPEPLARGAVAPEVDDREGAAPGFVVGTLRMVSAGGPCGTSIGLTLGVSGEVRSTALGDSLDPLDASDEVVTRWPAL